MKGDKTVIQFQNKQLTNELTAINLYFACAHVEPLPRQAGRTSVIIHWRE